MKQWPWRFVAAHPGDEALMARATGALLDASDEEHLQACSRCAERLAIYERAWQQVGLQARAEADTRFPEARLARQHAAIMRRLAQHGHPARVLPFPRHVRPARASRQVARRWVAASAAAGLVVGMAAGRFIDDGPHVPRIARSVASAPAATGVHTVAIPPSPADDTHTGDEALLVALEVAAATPRIEPLLALDAMTPRMPESAASSR